MGAALIDGVVGAFKVLNTAIDALVCNHDGMANTFDANVRF